MTLTDRTPERAKIRVRRAAVTDVLNTVLANHEVNDVSVEDPPLEEVIAEMFAQADLEAEGKLGQVPELLNEE